MNRIRLHRTDAIILKRHDFGEADRILTVYTPGMGKVRAVAKGVRRIASRKSGHVELFTHARLMLAEGRNVYVVTQAETVEPFRSLREELIRTTYAYHIVELVDRFAEEGIESPQVFDLLRDTLAALGDASDPALLARYFEIRILGLLGYQPQLFRCVACGSEPEVDGNAFGPEAGGVLCPRCAVGRRDAMALPGPSFRVLRFLQTRDWAVARNVELTAETRADLERLLHAYLRHLLERELKSVEFLKRLRKLAPATGPASPAVPSDPGPGAGGS